ncbi:TGF-beta receptor type-2 isoform X2 [Rhinoraja longicauda]
MGRLGESTPTSILILASVLNSLVISIFVETNLCKWCDYSNPICKDKVCFSNCTLNSYCVSSEEICVAIWRKNNESISVQTMCHYPHLPVEDVVISTYNTTVCIMTELPAGEGAVYVCGCTNEQECNDKLIFEADLNDYPVPQNNEVLPVAVLSLLPPTLIAFMVTMAFYLFRTRQQRKATQEWPEVEGRAQPRTADGKRSGYQTKGSVEPGDSHSDMSVTCANNINHNNELLPIELDAAVGKGRFAEVWRAKLKHSASGQYETVAVKIFPCEEYTSWRSEKKIFSDVDLKHENVLQFLTAEERGRGLEKQYWLITAYYSMGNLQDFLSTHTLTWTEMHTMAGSLVNGVAHLHSDYTAYRTPKIPISHRDIKSTNVLVSNKRECILCDFGLALRLDPTLTADNFADSGQVGTARYMAPEVLESRVNLEDLESFKQMDIYSMALVLWEMASRCQVIGEVKCYESPFSSKVREHPCVESMRDIVLRDRGRPEIPSHWQLHKGMHFLCDTIVECWDHDPEARLTAHCVAERINMMAQMNCDDVLDNNSAIEARKEGGSEPVTLESTAEHKNIQVVTDV